MEEKPVPTGAPQSGFGPFAGHDALTFSGEMPSRARPRHCGQSAANSAGVTHATAVINHSFITPFYHSTPGRAVPEAGAPIGHD